MTIGAVSFQPYVFNINAISPASMNRLSGISDDVLDKKTDFSDLAQAENEKSFEKWGRHSTLRVCWKCRCSAAEAMRRE